MYRHYYVILFINCRATLRKFVDKLFFLYQIYRDRANKNQAQGIFFFNNRAVCIAGNVEIYCKIASTNLPYLSLFTINKHRS